MFRILERFKNDESGQDLVEYAFLAAFLAVVSVAGLTSLGPVIADFYASLIPFLEL